MNGNGIPPPRSVPPREQPAFNSLAQGDEDALPAVAAPAPDFVGSKYQRTRAGGPEGVFVGDWAIRVARTMAELLVLAQLAYWFGEDKKGKLRARTTLDGFQWVYKSYARLAKEVHLSRDQVRGAVRSLVGRGLLITRAGSGAVELPHYRLDPRAIDREVEKAECGLPGVAGVPGKSK